MNQLNMMYFIVWLQDISNFSDTDTHVSVHMWVSTCMCVLLYAYGHGCINCPYRHASSSEAVVRRLRQLFLHLPLPPSLLHFLPPSLL